MSLLLQLVHRLPSGGRLLSPSSSPPCRAAAQALAHAAAGLPRSSIACAQCQALAVKRQGKITGDIRVWPQFFKLNRYPGGSLQGHTSKTQRLTLRDSLFAPAPTSG